MNFIGLVQKLRQSVGNPSTTDITDDQLKEIVNDSYIEVADKFRFYKTRKVCTFVTTSGESKYTLPASSVELKRVYDVTNQTLIDLMSDSEAQEYRLDESDSSTYDKPRYYTHYRDWIRFIPVPNGEYTMEIYYRIIATQLVQDDDEPVLPEPWHKGILLLARYHYYELLSDNTPKAIGAMNAYKLWLEDKPDEVAGELMNMSRGVIIPTLAGWPTVDNRDFEHGE